MARVLVLNATYEPINVCTLRRAAVLLLKEKAELLERREGELHSERMTMERPDVIRALAILIFACVTTHPTDLVRTDAIKWKRIVQDAGVTID